jgi:hypothetical protein
MDLKGTLRHVIYGMIAASCLLTAASSANAATFTVVNNCGYTVYPGIYPAVYDNGGWSMAPGSSVSFGVSSTFNGRLWGRQGCNGASPAVCSSGSCGGTGLQCAGTTGVAGTSLAEWNLDASGTDYYDVSYVDGQDTPLGMVVSNGSCVSPNTCSKIACTTEIVNGVDCLSPCTQTGSAQFCCAGAYNTAATCVVSAWPAADQDYVNNIHADCPNQYAYAYDDPVGLHTCGTGVNYTLTFCPNGSGSTGGTTGGTTGSTTGGGLSNGVHTLTPACATGSRLDDNNAATGDGNKIQIWGANGTAAQQWNFASIGTNTWNLAVNLGPYCLDGGAAQVGTPTQLWGCNGTNDQAWVSGPAAQSGDWNFASKQSGLCLDVSGAGSANGTVVQSYTCNGTTAQAWAVN